MTEIPNAPSIEMEWATASELPLAFGHRENWISARDEHEWAGGVKKFVDIYKPQWAGQFQTGKEFDAVKLQNKYRTKLRFLSRNDARQGLKVFATEIEQKFSAANGLFYFPPESASANLMYQTLLTINPKLREFGTVVDERDGLRIESKNKFAHKSVQAAEAFIYVDDWVLSGEHMRNFLTTDVDKRFYTYHLLASDAGQNFFKKAKGHLFPRYAFKVKSEDAGGAFSEVQAFGFHKIPDRIPDYYAIRHEDWYSVFGKKDGGYILRGQRLVDHRKAF